MNAATPATRGPIRNEIEAPSAIEAAALRSDRFRLEREGEWKRLAMPEPGTQEGTRILDFWVNSWIAAMATGIVVWALMFWAVWRYRRRHHRELAPPRHAARTRPRGRRTNARGR